MFPNNISYNQDNQYLIIDNYMQAIFNKLFTKSYFNNTSITPEIIGI